MDTPTRSGMWLQGSSRFYPPFISFSKFSLPIFPGFPIHHPSQEGSSSPTAVTRCFLSFNMGFSGELSLLKKVPKGGDFLPGQCHNVVLCDSPCWGDLSANKGHSALIRIRVVLVCRAAAKPLTHGELMGGLLPKYPHFGTFTEPRVPRHILGAQNSLLESRELGGSSTDVNRGNYPTESPGSASPVHSLAGSGGCFHGKRFIRARHCSPGPPAPSKNRI